MTGTDVIKTLSFSIFQTLVESGGRLLYQLSETVQQEIFQASKQYNQNYRERHGILKVLGMREPISLESVYISVQFLKQRSNYRFETIEALETAYKQSTNRTFHLKDAPRLSGIDVANQIQFLMILGGAGRGKSTFLRKIGLETLKGTDEGSYHHDCIPVFIELKEFRSGNIDLEASVANEFKTCGFPAHERFTAEALKQGKLLILLDGLDEIPTEHLNDAIANIRNFVDAYDKNRFIISCRDAAYRNNLKRFTDVEISDFCNEQIRHFILNWFAQDPQKGHECWRKLEGDEYIAAKELTHTPLLLTMVCLLYGKAGKFPTNRATLYEKSLRILLEEWSGEKGLPPVTLYQGLDTKRKELVLSKIAFDAFCQERLFIPKRDLVKQIESLLAEMLPDEKFIDGNATLRFIEIQHGILVERADGIYSFSHLTIQEFLTAQHIVDTRQPVGDIIAQHLTNSRWREVFLLLAGIQQADSLLQKIETQAQSYIQSPNLRSLLQWAEDTTKHSPSKHRPTIKRTIAIFLALDLARALALDRARVRALDLDIDRARSLALALDSTLTLNRALDLALARVLNLNRALDLVLELAYKFEEIKIFRNVQFNVLIARLEALRTKAPQYQSSAVNRKVFVEQIHQTWLNALHLKREWIDLSRAEVADFDAYLYANLLLVQCKHAAVWVTPHVWQAMEAHIMCANPTSSSAA